MDKKKNMYIIGYMVILAALMIVKIMNPMYGLDYMVFVIVVLYYGLWWFCFNYRFFTVSMNRLDALCFDGSDEILEYLPIIKYDDKQRTNVVHRLYVRAYSEKYFSEADYWLMLPKDSSLESYKKFIIANPSVMSLKNTMRWNSTRKDIRDQYEEVMATYSTLRGGFFALGVFLMVIYYAICQELY